MYVLLIGDVRVGVGVDSVEVYALVEDMWSCGLE